jgi:hypothetical protein
MISRVWHGWTSRENADAYEELLRTEIFTNIKKQSILGFRGIHLLRRDVDDGVEFVAIMWFDTLDAVRAFAGDTTNPPVSIGIPDIVTSRSVTTNEENLYMNRNRLTLSSGIVELCTWISRCIAWESLTPKYAYVEPPLCILILPPPISISPLS